MENSKIEWTDHTFNPWLGCEKVSAGCANCYAETMMDKRMGAVKWGKDGTRKRTSESYWRQPLKWDRDARRDGVRRRVFCASLADVFEDRPELEPWRESLLWLIYTTPNLDWLLLTKRPENIMRFVLAASACPKPIWAAHLPHGGRALPSMRSVAEMWMRGSPPPNVWPGTSVENQATADERIPLLLQCPAAVRFLSMEPLLGPVNLPIPSGAGLTRFPDDFSAWSEARQTGWINMQARATYIARCEIGFDWVIVGGESGQHARPMHPDWARGIRDQCAAAGVPFFFKQWGEFNAEGARVGKRLAGRLLDGIEHNAIPEAEP